MDTEATISILKPTYRYSSQYINIQVNVWILQPTYRYTSQRIDTQADISILKPTYRYSNQYIDIQANVSILQPIYRYKSQHFDTQANISILKPTYRYSNQYINIQTNVSILQPPYRYRSQHIDTEATISILKPLHQYHIRDVDEADVFKTMFCDVCIDVTVLFLRFRRLQYYALGNAEMSDRKYENSLTELVQFLISETICRFLYRVFVFLTRLMNLTLAIVLLIRVHVSILLTVSY